MKITLVSYHKKQRDCTHSTAPQGSPRTPATCIAATAPGLIFKILN